MFSENSHVHGWKWLTSICLDTFSLQPSCVRFFCLCYDCVWICAYWPHNNYGVFRLSLSSDVFTRFAYTGTEHCSDACNKAGDSTLEQIFACLAGKRMDNFLLLTSSAMQRFDECLKNLKVAEATLICKQDTKLVVSTARLAPCESDIFSTRNAVWLVPVDDVHLVDWHWH